MVGVHSNDPQEAMAVEKLTARCLTHYLPPLPSFPATPHSPVAIASPGDSGA